MHRELAQGPKDGQQHDDGRRPSGGHFRRRPRDWKRRGIVRSKRGQGGGYQLARDPATVNFGEVIRVLEGPLALTPCVSQTAYRRCDECPDEGACGVRLAMKKVRDATARILDNTTLAGLNAQVARACTPGADTARQGRVRRRKPVAI